MVKADSYSHDVPTTSPLPPVSVSKHTHTHAHFSLEFQCAQACDWFKPRVGKPWPEAKSDCPCFCMSHKLKLFFLLNTFKMVEKIKRKVIFCDP